LTENNFDIKRQEHFKLYVFLKDKIIFESELRKNGILFYTELNEQPMIENGIRYFLLDSDREKIDRVIIENKIVTNIESNMIIDYNFEKTNLKSYVLVAFGVGGILFLIILFVLAFTNNI
jgi:hypothetical protein